MPNEREISHGTRSRTLFHFILPNFYFILAEQRPAVGFIDWLDSSLCNDAELGDVRDLLVPIAHPAEPGLKVSNPDVRITWNRTLFSNWSYVSILKCSHNVCSNNSGKIMGQALYLWQALFWHNDVDVLSTVVRSALVSAQIAAVMDSRIEVAGY